MSEKIIVFPANKEHSNSNCEPIQIKLLSDTAKIPTLGSCGSAGYDLYADESCLIGPNEKYRINTNVAMSIPIGKTSKNTTNEQI